MSELNFIDVNPESILSEMIRDYEDAYFQLTGTKVQLAKSDTEMAHIAATAYRFSIFAMLVDRAAKNNLIDYANDIFLDAIGNRIGEQREEAMPSKTILEFKFTDARNEVFSIPKGTIVKSKSYFFKTDSYAEIKAGELSCLVNGSCLEVGKASNGIAVGNIDTIVTEFPVAIRVSNITTTQGGSEIQSNEDYRQSIKNAPNTFSVAGPALAYEALAKKFSDEILDVRAFSPADGVVDIRFILKDGEIPNQAMIDELMLFLSDKTRRPLTDKVVVSAPTQVNYSIDCTYYISSSDSDKIDAIKMEAERALGDYILWQKSKIKRAVDKTELIKLLKQSGVKRCVVTAPEYIELLESEVASDGEVNFIFGGLEYE